MISITFKKKIAFSALLLALLSLAASCGKVTQQLNTDKDSPSFLLSFSLEGLSLPASKFELDALSKLTLNTRSFTHDQAIYVAVEGLDEKKSKLLSWTKINMQRHETESEAKKLLFSYTAKITDLKNIEVKSAAKKSQIQAKLDTKKKKVSLEAPKLSYDYDYYVLSAFSSENRYYFDVISSETVSKNAKVQVDSLNDFNTFRGILFLKVNDSMLMSQEMYQQFLMLIDQPLYRSLSYTFPAYETKSFNEKKPYFHFEDALTNKLAELIEVAFVDVDECKAMLLRDKQLSEEQKAIFSNNLALISNE